MMITREVLNTNNRIARTVGVLFVAGMVIAIAGHMLMLSIVVTPGQLANVPANTMLLGVSALLMLLPAIWDAAHGVLMFPVLKRYSEGMAAGYLAFRITDAIFLALAVLFVLLQIPLANEFVKAGIADATNLQALSTLSVQANLYAYNIAMTFLGVAGLMLCFMFYRTKLVPRPVAVWGLVGYATILTGSLLEILGFGLSSIHTLPGGLWEVFIGVWLIAKGFSSSAIVPQAARTGNPAQPLAPVLDPAS
jgi:hypothetical protein